MNRLILPRLVAVREPGDVIASDVFNEKSHPMTFGFMFTSPEAFERFAASKPENKLVLHRLEYQSLMMTLMRTRNETNPELVILDYTYPASTRRKAMFVLFDVAEAIATLDKWGSNTQWGADTDKEPSSEKPPHPVVERLTGFY